LGFHFSWCVALSVLAITLLLPDTANAQSNLGTENRVALVVGNSTHQNVSRLKNLENARLIAQALNPTMPGALPSTTSRRSTSAARGSNRPIRLAALGGVNGTMTDAPPIGAGILPKLPTQETQDRSFQLPQPSPQPAEPWPANLGPVVPNWTPSPSDPNTPNQTPSIETPRPRQMPNLDPDVENPNQPTVVDNIRPMSVRTQIAQAPPGVIAGAVALPSSEPIPGAFDPSFPDPGPPPWRAAMR